MNDDIIAYLISRLIKRAEESSTELRQNEHDPFCQGRNLAYYEMLKSLKTDIDMFDFPVENYGLNINLEKFL